MYDICPHATIEQITPETGTAVFITFNTRTSNHMTEHLPLAARCSHWKLPVLYLAVTNKQIFKQIHITDSKLFFVFLQLCETIFIEFVHPTV